MRCRSGSKTLSITQLPAEIAGPFLRHIETLSQIAPRGNAGDVPREGRFRVRIKNRKLMVLVSSFPIIAGRRLVLELLDDERALLPLEALGLEEARLRRLEVALASRKGLIIVASPAGGGKGTTLYSLLGACLRDGRVVMTIEPSVKYPLKGVDQAALDPSSGFTMTEALRAASRQKADVFGLRGSMTSEDLSLVYSLAARHLVILAVEAGDIIEALEPFRPDEAADVVIGIIAQRIIPLLCPNCRRIHRHPENLPADMAGRLWAGANLQVRGRGAATAGGAATWARPRSSIPSSRPPSSRTFSAPDPSRRHYAGKRYSRGRTPYGRSSSRSPSPGRSMPRTSSASPRIPSTRGSSQTGRFPAALLSLLLAAAPVAAPGITVRSAPPAHPAGAYAGPDSCTPCHELQHRFQAGRRHARAMASLTGDSVNDPVCLRCHATGYGYAGGYGPGGGPPSLAGVTCEACHGPCGDHVATGARTAAAMADCPPCLLGKACLPCHTAERDPDFDLPKALGRAGCPK